MSRKQYYITVGPFAGGQFPGEEATVVAAGLRADECIIPETPSRGATTRFQRRLPGSLPCRSGKSVARHLCWGPVPAILCCGRAPDQNCTPVRVRPNWIRSAIGRGTARDTTKILSWPKSTVS